MPPKQITPADIERVRGIVSKYAGNFAGSAAAPLPELGNPNTKKVYFDANSSQSFTVNNGKAQLFDAKQKDNGLFHKIGAIASQTGSILQEGAAAAGGFLVHSGEDIGKQAYRAIRTPFDLGAAAYRTHSAEQKASVLRENLDRLTRAYAAGKVSRDDYQTQVGEINRGFDEVNDIIKSGFQAGNAAKQDAIGVAETAVNVLSMGRYKSLELAATKVAGLANPALIDRVGTNTLMAAKKVEDALQKIPAFRDLIARNADYFAGQAGKQLAGESFSQALARNGKNIAIGLLFKRPIIYQSNIESAQHIYNDVLSGNYPQALKDSAWIAAQAVSGGPLGWAFKQGKNLTGKVRTLANGKFSFIDELSKRIGNGAPGQLRDYLVSLKDSNPKLFKQTEEALRIAQEVNLRAASENVTHAAELVTSHYEQHAIDLQKLTPQQLVSDLHRWAEADKIAQKLSPKEGAQYVAVRWDKLAKNALAARVQAAGDNFNDMVNAVADVAQQPGVGWGNNPILYARITDAIRNAESSKAAASAIRKIETAAAASKDIPPATAKRLAKLGYTLAEPLGGRKTPAVDLKDTRKLISAVVNGATDIFDETVEPQPQLASLANILRKIGLSPESANTVAYDKLSAALVTNLQEVGVAVDMKLKDGEDPVKGGKFILSKLQAFINQQKPNPYLNIGTLRRGGQSALQDIRQMNTKEIQEALPGLTRDQAASVRSAVAKAYTDVPLEFRGLGTKAGDYAYRIPGANVYFRIQSALRYTYNPWFRTQEVVETKVLSHLKANNLLWLTPKQELDRVAQLLDDSHIFSSGLTGEAAQDLAIGRIHANLLKTQKRDLAGLAAAIAEKKGITIEEMARDHGDELADALRVVVQYPSKGVLNSSLARTINLMFFPMRYNLKVAGLVAKEVAKLPPTVQLAVIHSGFKVSSWLKSSEGIQWQSDHADAIQLYSYFLPAQNVVSVLHLLTGGKPNSLGEIGLLGGLPFGFISQILDAEGIIHLNTPYVDPKTGTVLPDYIPETTKARAAVALQGLMNSMFTYPGRIIGLPGKSALIRNQVSNFIDTNGSDFAKNVRTQDLTPLQRKTIEVLSNPDIKQSAIDELYTTPAKGQFDWYTLPPSHLPVPEVMTHAEATAKKRAAQGSKTRGKTKALPIPAQG